MGLPRAQPHLRLVEEPTPAARERRPEPPLLDDAQLLAALREGDPSTAAAFYERARPVVDRCIFRLLGRSDRDHDDLVQVSMIALIDSVERFRGECALDGWIATVTAHTVWKHLRRRKTESRIFHQPTWQPSLPDAQDAIAETHAARGLEPETQSVLRNAVGRIRGHLDALEPNKAWTFLLHHVCGHDLREIAEITEVSVAAAQQRLSRGRRELMARLRDDPELVDLVDEWDLQKDGGGER